MKLTDSDIQTIKTAQKINRPADEKLRRNNPDASGVHMIWTWGDTNNQRYNSWELLERIDAAMRIAGYESDISEPLSPAIHLTLGDIGYFEDSCAESALYTLVSDYISTETKPHNLARIGLEVLHQELMAPYYRQASQLLVEHAHQSAVGFN